LKYINKFKIEECDFGRKCRFLGTRTSANVLSESERLRESARKRIALLLRATADFLLFTGGAAVYAFFCHVSELLQWNLIFGSSSSKRVAVLINEE